MDPKVKPWTKFEVQENVMALQEAVRSLEGRMTALAEMVRVKLEEPIEPPGEDLGLVVIGLDDARE